MADLPKTQHAVQLIGPDKLILNTDKEVFRPGPYQILCRVEAVGLCFSDLKLLKQFSSHVRKSEIVSGIDQAVLKEISSYVPEEAPAVPGHETVVRIKEVGPNVDYYKPGQRCLVQTDYRWLRTASSNAAFGYNFEGALQQYVLMDERVITSPDGESMLLLADEGPASSAIALVEPWACVEDAYASTERTNIITNGQMLVVADIPVPEDALQNLFNKYGRPAQITWIGLSPCDVLQNNVSISLSPVPTGLGAPIKKAADISELPDAGYDDVIYFGSASNVVERLFAKVAGHGLLNIVLGGGRFGRDVIAVVGRVHYGGIRIVGTTGLDPAESMKTIPNNGEIQPDEKINIVGAGGPMGMMHVIRNICQGVEGISIFASDVDNNRLASLTRIAGPLAGKNNIEYKAYNPTKEKVDGDFNYTILMAPIPKLVAASIHSAAEQGIINIFAGIPTNISYPIDLDTYIEKRLYFIGTSGSTLSDMKLMLQKVQSKKLDTNISIAAISGLDGAIEGIRAVENRTITGKIIVYPACKGLGLIRLEELSEKLPKVANLLSNGSWTKHAEQKLLEQYQGM